MTEGPQAKNASLIERFDSWIFFSYPLSSHQLAFYRMIYASFALFVIGIPQYTWIASLPGAFFHPPLSVAAAFSGFPPRPILQLFGIALVILFFALLFGYRTRTTSVLITLVGITAESFAYSFGKINHARHLFFFLPLVMSCANWGAVLSIDASRPPRSRSQETRTWPITLMSLLLGFSMFTSGWPKLLGGWLDPTTPVVKEKVFQWHYAERQEHLVGFFTTLDSPVFWEFLDWATVVFELGFLVAVLVPGVFRFFAGLAVVFHTMVLLMLNIGFLPQLIVYPLFQMEQVRVREARLAHAQRFFRPWLALLLGGGYLGLLLGGLPVTVTMVASYALSHFFESAHHLVTLAIYLLALGITAWIALARGRRFGGAPR
jgi:hypothetical protein